MINTNDVLIQLIKSGKYGSMQVNDLVEVVNDMVAIMNASTFADRYAMQLIEFYDK